MSPADIANEAYSVGIADMVADGYNIALGIGVILALGIFIYAGVRYSASGGNPSAISDARSRIWAATLGLILLFSSVIILNVINPDLKDIDDIFFTKLEQIEPKDTKIPGIGGVVPDGGLDLSKLPKEGSGKGAIVLCGDSNACKSGTYFLLEVEGDETQSISNLELYPENAVRSDQMSYFMLAGDLERVSVYEDEDYGGVKIILNKDGKGNVDCTYEYYKEGIKTEADCTNKLSGEGDGIAGLNLHDICIVDDNGDGRCSNKWADDITSLRVKGGTGGVTSSGINPTQEGLMTGGVVPPEPDPTTVKNGTGYGVVYICGDNNPCTSGKYLAIPSVNGSPRDVKDLNNLKIGTEDHVGGGQASYIIIAGDISEVTFWSKKNLEGEKLVIKKYTEKIGSRRYVTYSCRTAFGGDDPGYNDCTGNLILNYNDNSIAKISLHNLCRVDDNHDGRCTDRWDDIIHSVEVKGGLVSQ